MELQRLRHLVALATHGTFRRAAEAVHLTQPALTRSIRILEAQLGVPLVLRGARGSTLTDAGRVLVERARRLLAEEEETRRAIRQLQTREPVVVRLGVSATAHALVGRPFVERLLHERPEHPERRAELVLGESQALVQGLRAGTLDAVAGDAETFAGAPELQVERLDRCPLWLVARRDHPLVGTGELTPEALRPYPVAAGPLSGANARAIATRLGAAGVAGRELQITSPDQAALEALVRTTDLLFVGSALASARAVAAGELVVLPFAPLREFHVHLALARRPERPPDAVERLFRDCLRAAIAEARAAVGLPRDAFA